VDTAAYEWTGTVSQEAVIPTFVMEMANTNFGRDADYVVVVFLSFSM
jgi:hypothetical protein